MKLKFFGTSHGVPMEDRFCTCTMIQCGGRNYLFDGGAPVADMLVRSKTPFSSIRAVFTSHIHPDHTFGLFQFCSLANWHYRDSDMDLYLTEQGAVELFPQVVRFCDKSFDDQRLRFRLVEPGTFYDDGVLKVTAIPTRHMEPYPSYAFLIEGEGKRILFTGDMKGPDAPDFPLEAAKIHCDLILCEMAHFGADAVRPYMEQCDTDRFWFHHVFHNYEKSMADIRGMEGQYPFLVHAVADGEEVEL